MPNEPIEILIKKSETASGTIPKLDEKTKEQGKPSAQVQAINNALIASGKQIINQGIRLQGDLSGNYVLSDSVNTLTSITADVLMIAKGGPIGVIAVASKYTIAIATSYTKQAVADRENAFIRQRTGFIATRGSRYTDD